jgi:hypothetical protein
VARGFAGAPPEFSGVGTGGSQKNCGVRCFFDSRRDTGLERDRPLAYRQR